MNCGKEDEKTMAAKTIDKELLKLAAKAAGGWLYDGTDGLCICNPTGGAKLWNPLADDGDALRLVFKLGLRVCIDNRAGVSWIKRFDSSTAHGDDAAAATRRAIVRAAACYAL